MGIQFKPSLKLTAKDGIAIKNGGHAQVHVFLIFCARNQRRWWNHVYRRVHHLHAGWPNVPQISVTDKQLPKTIICGSIPFKLSNQLLVTGRSAAATQENQKPDGNSDYREIRVPIQIAHL